MTTFYTLYSQAQLKILCFLYTKWNLLRITNVHMIKMLSIF